MAIYTFYLDKEEYFNSKKYIFLKKPVANLAQIINRYLVVAKGIDELYISGACWGKCEERVQDLIINSFVGVNKSNITINLVGKYNGYSYEKTKKVLENEKYHVETFLFSKKSDHRKMIFFIRDSIVQAILIGSSNYSPNTYLKHYSSEADVLMIDANGLANIDIVGMIERLKKGVNGIYQESSPDSTISKNLSEIDRNSSKKYNYPVISETIVCPDDFLFFLFNTYRSKISLDKK